MRVAVAPLGNKWQVEHGRRKSLHETQKEAEKRGMRIARKARAEFVLYGRRGQVVWRSDYRV